MDELADKWQDLTDIQQATVTELIAGKRQGNIVSSLMNNFDIAEGALKTSLGSSGSAMKEHEKAMDSIEAKLSQLKAAWQGFAQTFMTSDFLKTAISGLTKLVEILEKIVDTFGTLGTIGLGAGIFSLFKNFGNLKAFVGLASEIWSSGGKLSSRLADIGKAAGMATGSLSGMVGAIGIAVAAIGLAVNAYKNHKEAISQARQETIRTSDEFLDAADSFEQVYIKYSGRTDLTAEEESELETAIKGTVDALGNKSSALQSVVNSSNDYLASLEDIKQAELEEASRAAKKKRDNAKLELEDVVAGWSTIDGSEVDVVLADGSSSGNYKLDDTESKVEKIAKEVGSQYYKTLSHTGYRVEQKEFGFGLGVNGGESTDANEIVDYYHMLLKFQERLSDAGLESTSQYQKVNEAIQKLSESVKVYEDGIYEAAKAQYQLANGIPKTVEEYSKMRENILQSDDIKNLSLNGKTNLANTLDTEYAQYFDLSDNEFQARKFVGIIKGYGDGTKDGTDEIGTVETFLNMRTAVNDNECTVGEYMSELSNVRNMASEFDSEEKKEFETSFGIDTDSIQEQYDDVVKYVSRNYSSKITNANERMVYNQGIRDMIGGLSKSELTAAYNIKAEIDWDSVSLDDILKQIKEEAKLVEALNYTIAIDVETEGIEALNTAMSESVSATGLSSESINTLKARYAEFEAEGYNLSAMFEETSNGIHLNRNALKELENAYANDKLSETNDKLGVLKGRYDELTKEIDNCKDASDRAALYTEQQSIIDKINDLSTLAAQYKGLTSAYNEWLSVEESGQERDMYEKMLEGFENIDDEISRGWLDDGTIEFLELLTGRTNLASLSAKELKEVYKGLDTNIKNTNHSIRDFFTVDDDGNSTSKGVYNFLDAIGQLEEEEFGGKDIVKRDKNGKIIEFDIELAGGEKAIADALGISEELVQIMLRAADDAGFVVNLEGAYTQLADLKTEAEMARDTLISLQEKGFKKLQGIDVNFNLDAEGNDLVTEHEKAVKLLDKFKKDGKIDLKMQGAQEALDIAEYLTIKLDDLTEPRYMQIDTTTVDEELQDPIEKMQEFGDLVKEKHLVTLTGDTDDIEKTEAKMKKVAEEIEGLDPEIKAKVGIDDGWSAEEIADKLEKGEIEIPAEVQLDVQMSDDLKDMRLMMMHQLGLVSENELKLKVGFDIDESVVNELTEEEQEVVVKYIAENEEEFEKYTEEEKEAVVKLVVDGVDLEKYDVEDKEAIVNYIANGEEADGWTPEAKDAFVKYLVDGGDPDKFDPEDKDSWVVYNTDTTKPDGYNPNDPTATVTFEKDSSAVDNYDPPNFTRNVTYYVKKAFTTGANAGDKVLQQRFGFGEVNGTANINGTTGIAFAKGDWRTKKTETALTGEMGREIVVTPNNRWYTVGDTGAEFVNIPKGSIVFNHKQSEELLKYGKVTSNGGRAKSLVNGSAFASGTAYAGLSGGGIEPESSGKDKTEEVFDWIEVAISRLERDIDNFDKTVKGTFKSWSDRNNALSDEISKVSALIEKQDMASATYMHKANKVGLDESWAEKVREGSVDISTITDKSLAEKIKEYKDFYEKSINARDAVEDLKETEAGLYQQRFENIQTQYDGIIQGYEHTESMLNEYISQAEAKGHIVSKKYYDSLIANESSNIATLKQEQSALIKARDEAVASGKIVKGSQAWYEQCESIDAVTQSIEEANTSLIEYSNSIRDVDWQIFDLIQERISDIASEADFLIELMSNKDLFDDNGKFTEQGVATVGLHGQNYNTYMYAADEYANEITKLDEQISQDPYDQELLNRRRELIEAQRESILAAENEKNAIKDLIQEGIEKELDSLSELIDKKNEALESEKDLYEYTKNVAEQTENIASLRKQIASYDGFEDEETRAKIQELKVSLKEAEADLEETEWDRYIQNTEQMLDDLYNEYEMILNQRLDNVDFLIEQVIDGINMAAGVDGTITSALGADGAIASALGNTTTTIKDTLVSETNKVGTTLSAAMSSIWTGDGTGKAVLDIYGKDFQNKSTMANEALNSIKNNVLAMVDDVDKEAQQKVQQPQTQSSSVQNPTGNTSTNPPKQQEDKNNNKKKINGDAIMGIASAIWVYGKDAGWGNNPFRENKLTDKLGASDAKRVQDFINRYGETGQLYNYYLKHKDDLDKFYYKNISNYYNTYATGARKIDESQLAWTQEMGKEFIVRPSDGAILTPIAKGDSVLTSSASRNIWNMANSPSDFIKDNLNLSAANVPNNSNVNNAYSQHIDNVVFRMDNVKNYEEMISQMQKDKSFEKLILAMTINRIAGGSSLAKNKSIRK